MIELKFPDGAVRSFEPTATGRDVAASISPSLAKRAALVEINGRQWDVDRPLEGGGDFRLIMRDDPDALPRAAHASLEQIPDPELLSDLSRRRLRLLVAHG